MVLDLLNNQEKNKMDETKEKLIKYKDGEREIIQERLKIATEIKRREKR